MSCRRTAVDAIGSAATGANPAVRRFCKSAGGASQSEAASCRVSGDGVVDSPAAAGIGIVFPSDSRLTTLPERRLDSSPRARLSIRPAFWVSPARTRASYRTIASRYCRQMPGVYACGRGVSEPSWTADCHADSRSAGNAPGAGGGVAVTGFRGPTITLLAREMPSAPLGNITGRWLLPRFTRAHRDTVARTWANASSSRMTESPSASSQSPASAARKAAPKTVSPN